MNVDRDVGTSVTLVAVGKIVGCFGVKGYLKIYPTADDPERLQKLSTVFLGATIEECRMYTTEDVIIRGKGAVVKFDAVNDRTAAERLVGMHLFVEEHDAHPPQQGSYFTHDVIGCEVWSVEGQHIGTVEDVYRMPAQDVWVIRNGVKEQMIPAVKEFIKSVDIAQRKIIVKLIDGLIEQ